MRSNLLKNAYSMIAVPEATDGASCGSPDLSLTWRFGNYIIWEAETKTQRRKMAPGLQSWWLKNCWKLLEEEMSLVLQEGEGRLPLTLGGHKSEGSVPNGHLNRNSHPVSIHWVPSRPGTLLGAGERTDHEQHEVPAVPHSSGKQSLVYKIMMP